MVSKDLFLTVHHVVSNWRVLDTRAKRLRTSQLLVRMRQGVALIQKLLRPYYFHAYWGETPYDVDWKPRWAIKRDYSMWGRVDNDYRNAVVRELTYTW